MANLTRRVTVIRRGIKVTRTVRITTRLTRR